MTRVTTPPPLPKSKHRHRYGFWVLVLVLISPGLCAITWFLIYRVSNTSEVLKLEAKVRKRGEPLTLVELQSQYVEIPAGENAAVPLMLLWEKEDPRFWKAFAGGERPLPTRARGKINPSLPFLGILGKDARSFARSLPLPESVRVAAVSHLEANHEHMQAARQALSRPRCRFRVNITEGYSSLLPHLPEMRTEANNFAIQALVAADRGNTDGCINALGDATRVGNALASGPSLIDQLIRINCLTMVIEGAEQLLSRHHLSPNQLNALGVLFDQLRMTNALKQSFIAERVMVLSVFDLPPEASQQILSGGSGETTSADPANRVRWGLLHGAGVTTLDRRAVLETMEKAVGLAGQDSPDALAEYEQLFRDVRLRGRDFPPKVISAMLLPSLEHAVDKFAVLEARRRSALMALAIERYRAANNGALPLTLQLLVPRILPALPEDPFDGLPLRCKRLGTGYVVYSVGVDRHDDGGKPHPRGLPSKSSSVRWNFDEGFVVER